MSAVLAVSVLAVSVESVWPTWSDHVSCSFKAQPGFSTCLHVGTSAVWTRVANSVCPSGGNRVGSCYWSLSNIYSHHYGSLHSWGSLIGL